MSDFSHSEGLLVYWSYQEDAAKNVEESKYLLMARLGPMMPKFAMDPDATDPVEKNMGLYNDKCYWISGNRIVQEFSVGWKKADNTGYKVLGFGIFGYTGAPVRCPGDGLPPTSGYQLIADIFCIPKDAEKPDYEADYKWAKAEAIKYFNSQKDPRKTVGTQMD